MLVDDSALRSFHALELRRRRQVTQKRKAIEAQLRQQLEEQATATAVETSTNDAALPPTTGSDAHSSSISTPTPPIRQQLGAPQPCLVAAGGLGGGDDGGAGDGADAQSCEGRWVLKAY